MWGLVIILLLPVQGIDRMTVLKQFSTQTACLLEQRRVMGEMVQFYQDEIYLRTFELGCRLLAI